MSTAMPPPLLASAFVGPGPPQQQHALVGAKVNTVARWTEDRIQRFESKNKPMDQDTINKFFYDLTPKPTLAEVAHVMDAFRKDVGMTYATIDAHKKFNETYTKLYLPATILEIEKGKGGKGKDDKPTGRETKAPVYVNSAPLNKQIDTFFGKDPSRENIMAVHARMVADKGRNEYANKDAHHRFDELYHNYFLLLRDDVEGESKQMNPYTGNDVKQFFTHKPSDDDISKAQAHITDDLAIDKNDKTKKRFADDGGHREWDAEMKRRGAVTPAAPGAKKPPATDAKPAPPAKSRRAAIAATHGIEVAPVPETPAAHDPAAHPTPQPAATPPAAHDHVAHPVTTPAKPNKFRAAVKKVQAANKLMAKHVDDIGHGEEKVDSATQLAEFHKLFEGFGGKITEASKAVKNAKDIPAFVKAHGVETTSAVHSALVKMDTKLPQDIDAKVIQYVMDRLKNGDTASITAAVEKAREMMSATVHVEQLHAAAEATSAKLSHYMELHKADMARIKELTEKLAHTSGSEAKSTQADIVHTADESAQSAEDAAKIIRDVEYEMSILMSVLATMTTTLYGVSQVGLDNMVSVGKEVDKDVAVLTEAVKKAAAVPEE